MPKSWGIAFIYAFKKMHVLEDVWGQRDLNRVFLLCPCPGDAGSPGRHRPEGLSAPRQDWTHRPHCDHMILLPHCLHSPSATGYLCSLGGWNCPRILSWLQSLALFKNRARWNTWNWTCRMNRKKCMWYTWFIIYGKLSTGIFSLA